MAGGDLALRSAGDRHTVIVEKIVTGGQGLARLADGLVVLVPFVLPGETVVVAVKKRHKGFADGELLEVVTPSPQRVAPPCPVFGRCGGCQLQHGEYQAQLASKEGILRDLLGRDRHWSEAEIAGLYQPMLASPSPWGYRQRVRLQVDDHGRLGFFASHSHAVVAIEACPLAAAELNQVLGELRALRAFQQLVPQVEALELLLSPGGGRVEVRMHLRRKARAADQQAAREVACGVKLVQAVWLAVDGQAMIGPLGRERGEADDGLALTISATPGGRPLTLRFEAGGFCQVNQQQNEGLIHQLVAWAELGRQDRVLDLFCGMGNFSLPLALTAREVVGTDLQRSSIRGAQANALANQLTNCRFLRAEALEAIRVLRQAGEHFDCILLDPPRQGCRTIIPELAGLGAKKLIYVSCDPATLTRDLGALHEQGFRLRHLRGVDMFPQTAHLETITLLVRE